MHTKIFSATTIGVDAHCVEVEVDLSLGLMNFFIVGLPDTAIKESRQRIDTALKNCGIRIPDRKITVNLAPADLKKEGTLFDLPIAIGILQAAQLLSIPKDFLQETIFLGELSLDGSIKPIKGALAIAYDAQKLGKKRIILPAANAAEGALIKDIEVLGAQHLTQLIGYLRKESPLTPTPFSFVSQPPTTSEHEDFAQVKGQEQAKRALMIAAAGNHNILFIGPPGSGKTMLAKRLTSIMPPLTFAETLATSKIYSVTGKLNNKALITERPFRSPHHTISQAGLIGGGSYPQPGEVSLAHHGILFLDELTEFKRDTLEVLRQPLENYEVCIARAQQSVTFPASFLLIAALNPCPCGYYGDKKRKCCCSLEQINRYLNKLSGPLLDRIDIQIAVPAVDYESIKSPAKVLSSDEMRTKVAHARQKQYERSSASSLSLYNAHLTSQDIEKQCALAPEAESFVKTIFNKLNLSMRGYHKLLKIARTIADLDEQEHITVNELKEALLYRSLDRYFERQS